MSQPFVIRWVAGSAYAARQIGPTSTSSRSIAPRAAFAIWRKVTSTAATRPADSQAPSFQFAGPSVIRGSKLVFWRTANTPPAAGQASGPPTPLPGIATWTMARSVAVTNWAKTDTR